MTSQILTFARGGTPVKKVIKLDTFLVDAVKFSLMGTRVVPKFSIERNHYPVEVDPTQLNHVVNNIIANAIQAMPEGGAVDISAGNCSGVTLRKRIVPETKGKHFVKISLADFGNGIPEEFLDKVFDPYFSTKRKGGGLGLAICHSIIRKHSGYIDVESSVEGGTAFHIYLPASDKNISLESEEKEMAIHKGTGNILVMDDDELVGGVLKHFLINLGYVPEIVYDGKDALKKYEEVHGSDKSFDAVILDLTVPGGMGGLECLRKLKELDPKVKGIVVSGYSNDQVLSDYEKFGFKGMVAKPFTIETVSNEIKKVLKA